MVAAIVAAALSTACQTDDFRPLNRTDSTSLTGHIVRVESLSLTELAVLEIQDEAGKIWTFEAQGRGFAQFTPSHLREHQVLGLKVQVRYHKEADALVIDGISD